MQQWNALFFIGFTAVLLAAIISPAAAYYTVAPTIDKGATIFIGEQGLNVTHALNQARGTTTPAAKNSLPTLTSIGWWASAADLYTAAPSKTIDLNVSGRYRSMTVLPADFVGYTGYWYLLSANGTSPYSINAMVFSVKDPYLDLRIWDFDEYMDVTGRWATRGDSLGFGIDTNMQGALNSRYRSPVYNSANDGYIDIKVKNESGFIYTRLSDSSNIPRNILRQNVSSSTWTWGDPANPSSPHPWATGVAGGGGQPVYPQGTYAVWAESWLNNMKANYKQGGADYTGKTVSQVSTITLLNEALQIESNRDSVSRGSRFSVTITGKPKTAYFLWVNNTGTMTGAPGNQPPTILVSAPVYQDPYGGPYAIGAHPIFGAGGKTILQDVPPSTKNVSRNEYYAKVVTSYGGTATVEFRTSPQTKPGTYRIRAENNTLSDDVTVLVVPDILPGPTDPDIAGKVIYRPLINPDVPVPANNDLKRVRQEGTVFIGEEGLNISEALVSANAAAVPAISPNGTVIGWWAWEADIFVTPPTKTLDLAGRETSFKVSPAEFVGYTGTWYLLNSSNGKAATDSHGNPIPLFLVTDPSLDIRIWDLDVNADITGKSVPQGERLTFRIDTNMYPAFDSRYRPDISGSTPGTITLIVKNEEGARYTYLYQNNTTAISLLDQRVDRQPYFWGGGKGVPTAGGYWGTDLLDRDHYYFYPVGTYTVWAESTLNRMKDNYKCGGADYTGKTVSQAFTITLVTERVKIEANKDTVTRGKPFSVTVSGKPGSVYYLWVKDTSSLTGGPNNQAPMITPSQEKVYLDSPTGPAFPIGSYQYENGGARTIKMNVGTDPVYNGTRYYAKIITSTSGTRTIEFRTDSLTRNRTYTLRVENLSGSRYRSDEVNITVVRNTPLSGIGVFRPSTHTFYLKNGTRNTTVTWGLSTDKPVSGDWNGDGMGDVGVFRPSTRMFYLKNGTANTTVRWGLSTDKPVSGDWNGDGLSDIGVYRPSTHTFFLNNGTKNTSVNWGLSTDLPVSGDWNGDGMGDVGVFRPSTHTFYLKNGTRTTTVKWGLSTDLPVSGDWNGDGLSDIGVYRPSTHTFYLKNGTANTTVSWGLSTDMPVSGKWS